MQLEQLRAGPDCSRACISGKAVSNAERVLATQRKPARERFGQRVEPGEVVTEDVKGADRLGHGRPASAVF